MRCMELFLLRVHLATYISPEKCISKIIRSAHRMQHMAAELVAWIVASN